jgi:hypothetical protein
VPKLPFDVPARTPEEIIRLAFSGIDPEVFDPPAWQLEVEAIDAADLHHVLSIVALHGAYVAELPDDRTKRGYLQGVLDAALSDQVPIGATHD